MWTGAVPGVHQEPLTAVKRRVTEGLNTPEQGRQWYDAAHYKKVADAYDFSLREGLNTTDHVRETLNLKTPGQARRHIWRARRAGLLPPTDERVPKGNTE